MEHLNTDDSYAERRLLFKNVWVGALENEEPESINITNKPKVIKTLRLDEIDRCYLSKKKKIKLRNLRHVCNKLLDVCDRQDTDNLYEQINSEGYSQIHDATNTSFKKQKMRKSKKPNLPNEISPHIKLKKIGCAHTKMKGKDSKKKHPVITEV